MAILDNGWVRQADLAVGRANQSLWYYNGRIYQFGGYIGNGVVASASYSTGIDAARVESDGSLGPWERVGSLPKPPSNFGWINFGLTMFRDNVYMLGGDFGGAIQLTCFQAKIGTDGRVGAFTPMPTMLTATGFGVQPFVKDNYLWCPLYGGDNYRCRLFPDGSTGPWINRTVTRTGGQGTFATTVERNGWIYSAGGFVGAGPVSGVYRVKIDNGDHGLWGAPVADLGLRWRHTSLAVGNTIFWMGGQTTSLSSSLVTTVQAANVANDGSLDKIQTISPLVVAVRNARSVYARGRIYLIGGSDGTGSAIRTVQSLYVG